MRGHGVLRLCAQAVLVAAIVLIVLKLEGSSTPTRITPACRRALGNPVVSAAAAAAPSTVAAAAAAAPTAAVAATACPQSPSALPGHPPTPAPPPPPSAASSCKSPCLGGSALATPLCASVEKGEELLAATASAVRARANADGTSGEPFTQSSLRALHTCAQPGGDALAWSPLRDVLFVVLASSTTLDRVRALRKTWASQLSIGVNLLIVGDADVPGTGVDMTTLPELVGRGERGHAGHRTLRALIFAARDARYEGFAWLFAVDDDTFVNLAAMPALIGGWDVRVPMLLSFIWNSPGFNAGRTWPSGGAGMLMTRAAVRAFAEKLYSPQCPFDGENDLTLGTCAWRLGVALVHSPLFDPEADSLAEKSTWARDKNDATIRTLVAIHRAGPERMHELHAAAQRHEADNALALAPR